jgi:ribosomal protein S18 acetylase RimI-like enzyme
MEATTRTTTRPYAGPADFDAMLRVVSESWRIGGPHANGTVGDLEWWTVNDPDQPLEGQAELWLLDDRPVGWAWPDPPSAADWHLQPGVPRAPFLDPLLERAEAVARTAKAAGVVGPLISLAGRREDGPVAATTTWAMDSDAGAIEVLTRRGYAPDGLAMSHWIRALPAGGGAPVPDPPLPPGYRHAGVRWPDDVPARVEVHRSAFAPSRMTIEKYRILDGLPHYSPERDRVIVAPDGSFAAFANAWYDPEARIGELEPVGTHADHRRLGLARGVCFAAMQTLEAAGARHVLIFSGQHNAASEALYESLGCTRATTSRRYARPVSD